MRSLIPLLEDNGKMHDAAVIVFAHFPASPQQLMHLTQYTWINAILAVQLMRHQVESVLTTNGIAQ
jgi:hypothetical protein